MCSLPKVYGAIRFRTMLHTVLQGVLHKMVRIGFHIIMHIHI